MHVATRGCLAAVLWAAVVPWGVAWGQSLPPWPVSHTPHPPATRTGAGSVEEGTAVPADFSLAMPGRVTVRFLADRAQRVLVLRQSPPRINALRGVPPTVLGGGSCTTPCSLYLPPGSVVVRAHGPGLRDTDGSFDVPATGVDVHLRSGSRALYNLGVGMVSLGATAFAAESVAAIAAQTRGESLPTTSAVIVAVAATLLLAAGVPWMITERTGLTLTAPSSAQ